MNSFGLSSVNGSSSDFPVEASPDVPSSVSRSGRVRKKNSLLAGFESLDQLERGRKKTEKTPKSREKPSHVPKVTLHLGAEDDDETPKRGVKKITGKRIKLETGRKSYDEDYSLNHDFEEGELEIDLPTDFESGLPVVAAEEIIDESLLDAEDNATEITDHSSAHRLKSQAQSTYFMEKSLEKSKKGGHPGADGSFSGKIKQTRKDKGSSRITAYMLWAKDQRVTFAKKNPGMDLPQMSKKLSDLWATVPQNQKKIWKSKAAKEMKKALHMNDNIKHSGPKPVVHVPVKRGPKPKSQVQSTNRVVLQQEVVPPTAPSVAPKPPKMKKSSPEVNGHSAKIVNNRISPKGKPKIVMTNGKGKLSPPETLKISPKGRPPSKLMNSTPKPKGASQSVQTNREGSNHLSQSSPPAKPERRFLSKGVANRNGYGGAFSAAKVNPPAPQPKNYSPRKEEELPAYKVTTTSPLDVAAHFSLLGESLSIIGERLRAHEGENVSGSLSVLLDSMLCALGPLACLTKQVPELNSIPDRNLSNILDDIAYIMPGL